MRGYRLNVAPGRVPELVVRPRAGDREIAAAQDAHRGWLARQHARLPAPVIGLDRVSVNEADGRADARIMIEPIAEEEGAALGVRHRRIAIRDTRTRWGSCSAAGTLSFSWRLVPSPYEVLDYAVVHEVCHLVAPSQSAGFWGLVESSRPGYRAGKAWLGEHGWELQAYSPPA